MNKQAYLHELEKALKAAHVQDCADILEEYAEHFERKLQDGYGEEEIAAKLAPPKQIAGQYAGIAPEGGAGRAGGVLAKAGLSLLDVFVAMFFIILCAWVFLLGVLAAALLGLGIVVITGVPLWGFLPPMPYLCAALLGVALLALAVLSAIGTEYCRLYTVQVGRAYAQWHKGVWGRSTMSPPVPLHPVLAPKKRRVMRGIALISMVVFAVALIVAFASMVLLSGSIEPWHVWRWFA